MPRRSLTTDDGVFEYRTSDRETRYGVRLRIHGQLWQRQGFKTKTAAQRVRDKVRVERFEGIFFPEKYQRQRTAGLTIADACTYVLEDYRRHNRRSTQSAAGLASFWKKEAGRLGADTVTARRLLTWADRWLKQGLGPATVNRRISHLLRGMRLANAQGAGLTLPQWEPLEEPPPRSGFIEYPTFGSIRSTLPARHHVPITVLFWTGMRYSEATGIKRTQATFDHRKQRVKLDLSGKQTKNKDARFVIMCGDLYRVLADAEENTRRHFPSCPWLCHYQGRRVGQIDTAWKTACVKLGLGTGTWMKGKGYWKGYNGLLIHDLRRSGVRNLIQAGVPEKVAMRISGHKTRAVFDRYHIVVEEDLAEAGRKVVEYCESLSMNQSMSTNTAP